MKEYKIKSFEFANSLVTQLITLTTILIGVSVTFVEKFETSFFLVLIISWILFFISLISGIFALMAIAGNLSEMGDDKDANNNIYKKGIRLPSAIQIITFLLGLSLLIIFSLSLIHI